MNKELKELVDLCKPIEHKNVSTLDTQIVELPIACLTPNSENFYDTTDLMDLKESIKEHGLLHPIAVTELGIIISGERRWRAIGQLFSETGDEQYSKIPAVVITAENPTPKTFRQAHIDLLEEVADVYVSLGELLSLADWDTVAHIRAEKENRWIRRLEERESK